MIKQYEELLTIALQCGISILDFYKMTPKEVMESIDAYNKREKLSLKEQALLCYQQAQLISLFVGAMLSNKKDNLPTLYEAFPSLFDEELKQSEIQREKELLINFVNQHNARR